MVFTERASAAGRAAGRGGAVLTRLPQLATLALAFFTLVASFFFHAFWNLPADKQMMQQLLFFKNVGVTGGLLALAAFGAGGWSLDARQSGR